MLTRHRVGGTPMTGHVSGRRQLVPARPKSTHIDGSADGPLDVPEHAAHNVQ